MPSLASIPIAASEQSAALGTVLIALGVGGIVAAAFMVWTRRMSQRRAAAIVAGQGGWRNDLVRRKMNSLNSVKASMNDQERIRGMKIARHLETFMRYWIRGLFVGGLLMLIVGIIISVDH